MKLDVLKIKWFKKKHIPEKQKQNQKTNNNKNLKKKKTPQKNKKQKNKTKQKTHQNQTKPMNQKNIPYGDLIQPRNFPFAPPFK